MALERASSGVRYMTHDMRYELDAVTVLTDDLGRQGTEEDGAVLSELA
jgi:hypothetical protein